MTEVRRLLLDVQGGEADGTERIGLRNREPADVLVVDVGEQVVEQRQRIVGAEPQRLAELADVAGGRVAAVDGLAA